jgi:subtilisin family serine protease
VDAGGRTTPFTGSESLEPFSSDGPRRIFYNPDGTAITPGNVSSTGGRVRLKPDITAADGVATATPGFADFHGTSAAAPHAAAIAALLLSAQAPAAQIRHALTSTALPAATWNENAGYGIIMADRALNALSLKRNLPPLMLILE